jgi:peptide/nickel transport system substrate-binding protein
MKFRKLFSVLMILSLLFGISVFTLAATGPTTLNLFDQTYGREAFESPYWSRGTTAALLWSSLLFVNENLVAEEPDLAERWDVSSNELTYTFYLRKGLKWHDGEPLTAEDVKWSFETAIINPRTNARPANALKCIKGSKEYADGEVENVSGIEILDETTIQITLYTPSVLFLNLVTNCYILPKHLLKDEDPLRFHLAQYFMKPIGSGPYKIVDRKPGEYTLLEPFEDYYTGKAKIDKVVLRYWSNPLVAFEAGELDFNMLPMGLDITDLLKVPHLKVTPIIKPYLRFLAIKGDVPPLDDVRVRRALSYAIDKESLVKQFFKGDSAVPIYTNMYPGIWVNEDIKPYEYNPEKAKELLKEAGWDSNIVVDLIYYYDNQETRDMMAVIQYYWDQVGVKCEYRLVPGAVATETINVLHDFDVWYGASSCIDPLDHLGIWLTNFNRGTGHQNPRYDQLHKKSIRTINLEQKKEYIDEMQEILHETVVTIPLYSPVLFLVENRRLNRPFVEFDLWNHYYLQIEKWEINQ